MGAEGILERRGTQLEEGNEFWRKALTVSNGALVPATVEIRVKGMSAAQFGDWFKSALDVQETLISDNPEHYRIQWNVSPSEDPEGFGIILVTAALGGILTQFDSNWGR